MAYSTFNNQLEEDDNEQPGQVAVRPGSTQTSSGGTSSGNGPSSAAPPTSGQGSPNNQRTWAGINDYLKSNKGQTTNLANQIGNTVREEGNQARSAIQSGTEQFNNDVNKNTTNIDQRVLDRVKNDPTALVGSVKDLSSVQKPIQPAFNFTRDNRYVNANPPTNAGSNIQFSGDLSKQKDTLNNLNDLGTLVNMKNAEYTGPTSLAEDKYYTPMQTAVSKAETDAANAKTEEGTRNLLSDIQKQQTGSVNNGALALDNALLRSDPNARNIIQNAGASNDDLNKLLTDAVGASGSTSAAAKVGTQRTADTVKGEIAGARTDFNTALSNRVDEAIANSNNVQEAIRNVLATGAQPSPDQLAAMGVTPEQWAQITNPDYAGELNLSDYLTTSDPNINAATIATPEDYARDKALEMLSGESDDTLTDPSLAGTYDDGVNFDVPTVMNKIDQIIAARQADKDAYEKHEMERIQQAVASGNYQGAGYQPYPGKGNW